MPATLPRVNDIQFSIRQLRKSPGFALTAILTLALGIGAVTSVFSVVNSVLLTPFAFPDPGRLTMIRETTPGLIWGLEPINAAHYLNWQANARSFSGMAIFQNSSYSISLGTDHPEIVRGLAVEPNFFSVLGVQPALGRSFLPGEDKKGRNQVVVLSWSAWQRYFHGDPGAIGRTMQDGGEPVTVVGVLPADFSFPRVSELPTAISQNQVQSYQIFRPLLIDPNQLDDFGDFNFLAIGRLRAGVTPQQAESELNAIQGGFNQAKKVPVSVTVSVQPLITEVTGNIRPALWLLFAAVGAVLLIGCVNLANLQLARAVYRERELALRAALGAGRDRLLWSSLVDSMVLAAVGGALGILLAFVGVQLFLAAAPRTLPRLAETHVSWPVLLAAAGLSIVTALFFGLLPALRSMRVDPQSALQNSTGRVSSSRESQRTRHLLVAGEVACTLALLIVTGLLLRSFSRLLNQDRDFDSAHVTLMSVYLYSPQYGDEKADSAKLRAAFFDRAIDNISHIPGVQSVATTSELPMAGETWIDDIERPDHALPRGQTPSANIRWVSPGYASTLRIPVVAGRDLQPSDKDHPTNILMSQQAVRAIFPGENPIGKQVFFGGDKGFTVVGILADARINDLKSTANMIYVPYWQNPWWRVHFLVRSRQATSGLAPEMRHAIWKIDPTVAIPVLKPLDEQVSDSVATERFQTLLLTGFGAAALLLALLGVYGVLAYSVSLRQQEFGIRIALGSDKSRLTALVLRQAAWPVLTGAAAGLVLAFAAARWVSSLLYQTQPVDPIAIAGSLILLIAAATLAAVLPARRAASVDPIQVLRNE